MTLSSSVLYCVFTEDFTCSQGFKNDLYVDDFQIYIFWTDFYPSFKSSKQLISS